MTRAWLSGVALVAAACSSSGGAPPAATPAPAPAPGAMITPEAPRGPAIHYPKSGGGIARYAFSRRDTVVATMPSGEMQEVIAGRTAFLTVTWVASDSGSRITAAIDSVVPDSGMSPAAITVLDSARASRWTAFRTPSGKLTNIAGGNASVAADQIRDQLFLLFPLLPKGGAAAGQSWTDSVEVPTRLSAFPITEMVVRQSVAGEATGSSPLPIDVVRQRSASSKIMQYGQEMLVAGEGVDSLLYQLGGDGRVLSVEGRRHTSINIQLPAVGQSVPAQETSALRMTLLR